MDRDTPLKAVFFKSENDNQPCRDFILSLSRKDKTEVRAKIFEVQKGFPMGLPLVRKMDSDLWEIRTEITDGICRIFFTIKDDTMILLHGFVKKSQKTPKQELKTAKNRLTNFKEQNK